MSKEGVHEGTIGVRPPKHLRPLLREIAGQLDMTEGQFLHRSAEAIIRMIEAAIPMVPRLVTAARVLRANDATFASDERAFSGDTRILHVPRQSNISAVASPRPRKAKTPKSQRQ